MNNFKVVLLIFCCAFIPAFQNNQTQESETLKHSETCPKTCELCDKVVKNALKFIASSQQEDGSWPSKMAPIETTAFNGLALLASGSTPEKGDYKDQLKLCKEYMLKIGNKMKIFKEGFCWDTIYVALFLTELYNVDKSDEIKAALEQILTILKNKQTKSGGWNYGGAFKRSRRIAIRPLNITGDHVATTNHTVLLLAYLSTAGFKIDEKVITKVRSLYEDPLNKEDSFGYVLGSNKDKLGPSQAGHTFGSLLPLNLLGLKNDKEDSVYQKAASYILKNFTREIDGKKYAQFELSHHGFAYHHFCSALASYMDGGKLWKEYWNHAREQIAANQAEDGSIFITPPEEADMPMDEALGKNYTTAMYTIILQLGQEKMLLHKLKPLTNKTTEK